MYYLNEAGERLHFHLHLLADRWGYRPIQMVGVPLLPSGYVIVANSDLMVFHWVNDKFEMSAPYLEPYDAYLRAFINAGSLNSEEKGC